MLKLHLDTDLGGDMDDLCALAMVLNWPDVELVAVTTVADDGGRRAGYTRYALDLVGRSDIPVTAGADISLGCYRGRPGFPEEARYWPEPVPPIPGPLEAALASLERSIEAGALIAAIGPYTNLALLEKRSPGILAKAKLYLMGGYVFPPREGFPAWDHTMDYNIQVDVQSAHAVLQCSNPTLITLASTAETALRRAYLPALSRSGPLAQLIARQAEAFALDEKMETQYGQSCPAVPPDLINFQHDALACAIALGWAEGVAVRTLPLISEIEDGWLSQRIDDYGKPTQVVTRVDGPRFSEFWLRTVTS